MLLSLMGSFNGVRLAVSSFSVFGGKCDFEGPNDELLQLELVLLSGVGGRIVFCCSCGSSTGD